MIQPLYEYDDSVHCYFKKAMPVRQILKSRVAPADRYEKYEGRAPPVSLGNP
ncbi:hypothetical protein PROSTU_03711 [Providencia stuartii ATCC 25827]|uniref:Uncharacterized protein n=1 Tax=Providencia stuartii ATCC 25827 TaxID=471874 RepID=A0AA86Z1D2_PROST|nr:hypothetical protein PROSTU_03711 [Providencia stuartii ATCC 25827]